MHWSKTKRRPGFTMMELLVVIAVVGVLAGLAIYFVPSFNTSAKSARGAADLQQLLVSARQRAIRNQSPYGLRIMFDPVTGLAAKCQYLEQPDDLGAGRYYDTASASWLNLQLRASPDGSTKKVWVTTSGTPVAPAFNFGPVVAGRLSGADGINYTDDDPPVQIGDYLEINGSGISHAIIGSEPSDPKNKPAIFDMLVLYSDLPQSIGTPITNFRVIRQPRVVGDETFDLPRSIVVDGRTNGLARVLPTISGIYTDGVQYPIPASFVEALPTDPAGNLDIMFSPTGTVMPGDASKARIYLWVRSTDYAGLFDGEPTLIVVSINSGLVAAYPVNVGNASD